MVVLIKSGMQLKRWLKSQPVDSTQHYGKFIDEGLLLIADEPYLKEARVEPYPWPLNGPLDKLQLPKPDDAKQWWNALIDTCEWEFRIYDGHLLRKFCCAARKGTWDTLPNIYCDHPKDRFTSVGYTKFLKTVGPEIDREMGLEVRLLGISTRTIKIKSEIPKAIDQLLAKIQSRGKGKTTKKQKKK